MTDATQEPEGELPTRRDFIYVATGMMGVVGAAAAAWPFIDQMNPAGDTLALASIEFDLTTDALPIRIGEAQVLTQ